MKKRLFTGILMLAIFIPLLVVNELFIGFQVLMMFLAVVASHEMISMYEKDREFPGMSKYIIMGCSILLYLSAIAEWASQANEQGSTLSYQLLKLLNINIGFLPMTLLIILIIFSMLVAYDSFNGVYVGKALTVICYSGLGFAALTILRSVGLRFVLFMFIITSFTDIFAYVFGSLFGKHKMAPNISPKKTWEGAICGTVIATIAGTLFGFFYGAMFAGTFGPTNATTILNDTPFISKASLDRLGQVGIFFLIMILSFLTSVFGSIGDLVASKLKRTYNIKDYGYIFPGHGGVLDRLDSALFAALFLLAIFALMTGFGG